MKKFLSKVLVTVTASVIISISILPTFAATYFEYDHFTYMKNTSSTIIITDYDNFSKDMVIPTEILGNTVVGIGEGAFYGNKNIISAAIPETVTKIDDAAFYMAQSMSSVVIPDSCTYLGSSTFQYCLSLTDVKLGAGIKKINSQTFYSCINLETIVIPDSVESIDNFAFADCTSLTSVTIPESVTSISDTAFKTCENLTIYGYADSYAQEYALTNGIPFEVLPPKFKIGDVNLDGTISVDDVTFLQMHIARYENFVSEDSYEVADFDGNGTIDINDVTMIQLYLAGFVL